MDGKRKTLFIAGAFCLLLAGGTIGYSLLLRVSFIDALYMTVITISTVGFKEVAEMNDPAKLFSILVIFAGLGLVGYSLTNLAAFLVEGDLRDAWRRRRMKANMEKLTGHYILCGAGETGESVIRQLSRSGALFVVIDSDEDRVDELVRNGVMALHGDATQEEVLKRAGILEARGLISSLSTDAANVFTVLTSRFLNKDLYIISRAIEPHAHEKLRKAGADRTLSPNEIGGRRMAALMLRPTIISFLDLITMVGDRELDLEEVVLFPGSGLTGLSLREARIPEATGLLVLAIQRAGTADMAFNPGADTILGEGDAIIVLGTTTQVAVLKDMARDTGDRECQSDRPT